MPKLSLDDNTINAFCKLSLACDAAPLSVNRREIGICGRCDEAQKKRAKTKPLRGVNTALPSLKKPT